MYMCLWSPTQNHETWVWILPGSRTICVTLNKFLNVHETLFPHLSSRNNNKAYLTGWSKGLIQEYISQSKRQILGVSRWHSRLRTWRHGCYGSGLNRGPRTPTCRRCGRKKKKKKDIYCVIPLMELPGVFRLIEGSMVVARGWEEVTGGSKFQLWEMKSPGDRCVKPCLALLVRYRALQNRWDGWISCEVFLPEKQKQSKNQKWRTQGNFGRGWVRWVTWLWKWYHRCLHMSKLIKIHASVCMSMIFP